MTASVDAGRGRGHHDEGGPGSRAGEHGKHDGGKNKGGKDKSHSATGKDKSAKVWPRA